LKSSDILRAWGKILAGRIPSLSVEITRECPLSCPGCYAYGANHLGVAQGLRNLKDSRGDELVEGILRLVDRYRPLHLSLVGGEPLVRYREITALLPSLEQRGIHTQVVTSAVRPIPEEWRGARKLNIVVSIDGLRPEHDARRAPATYDRILRHIRGHRITVHCTITRGMTATAGYLREFVESWRSRDEVKKIWMSIFTPQLGEENPESLPHDVRARVLDELLSLKGEYPCLELPDGLLESYRFPPADPRKCIFSRTTRTISADLSKEITPCQLGGTPDCRQCGCIAAAALQAVGRHRLWLGIRVGWIYETSCAVGRRIDTLRQALAECPEVSGERQPEIPDHKMLLADCSEN
jgi:MoaA/NifB/PqqE/SkfB family radical SAM enzyme